MSNTHEKFVVLTITHGEAKVWATGVKKGETPTKIEVPATAEHHHSRRDVKPVATSKESPETIGYFEGICGAISGADQILLIGHGKGKASEMLHFIQYVERKRPDIAKKVVDALDENLAVLTDHQVLAIARDWQMSSSTSI